MSKIRDFLNYHREPYIKLLLEDVELKGKVKSVEYKDYSAEETHNGNFVKCRKTSHKCTSFDEKGRFTAVFDECDGTLLRYFYNKNGGFEKIEECNDSGEVYLHHTFRYDEQGNMVAHNMVHINGEFWDRERYKYNKSGKITVIDNIDAFNKAYEKKRYLYKGNTVIERKNKGREIKECDRHTYNEKGQLIKVEWYKYKYFDFIYDEKGNLVMFKECYAGNGEVYERFTLKYDKHNNLSEVFVEKNSIKKKGGKERTQYQYEYDEHGNWTQRLIREDGDIYSVEMRKIEYY